jgi:hypothetical protein
MTALLTDTVRAIGQTAGSLPKATGVPIVAFALLLVLLIERETARPALGAERAARWRSLAFVLVPLVVLFLSAVTAQITDLLA